MKLIFEKEPEENLSVKIETCKGNKINFNYIELIEMLYQGDNIEEIVYPEDIEEQQKENIEQMIEKINDEVKQYIES